MVYRRACGGNAIWIEFHRRRRISMQDARIDTINEKSHHSFPEYFSQLISFAQVVDWIWPLNSRNQLMMFYFLHCTLYNLQSSIYSVNCKVYSVQCTIYNVQRTLHSVQCTVSTVNCTVYTVQRATSQHAAMDLNACSCNCQWSTTHNCCYIVLMAVILY